MASIYKRGQCWYLQFTEKGKRHRYSLGPINKIEAQAHKRNKELYLRAQNSVNYTSPAFSQFVKDYQRWYDNEYPASCDRVRYAFKRLEPHFGHTPIGAITTRDVEEYKHLRTAAAGTVAKEMRVLQAAVNKAVEWGIIHENQIRGVKPPKELKGKPPRWYTLDELQNIYTGHLGNVWKLMVNTGIRRTEAINLKWKDVNEDSIQILSTPEERTKSGKWRQIPLSEGAREAMDELHGDEYVIPRMQPHSLTTAFKRVLGDIKLDGSIHCLRHTFCSHLVMNGIPLYTVMELAGHADIKTTQIYAHLAPGHLQDAVRDLKL